MSADESCLSQGRSDDVECGGGAGSDIDSSNNTQVVTDTVRRPEGLSVSEHASRNALLRNGFLQTWRYCRLYLEPRTRNGLPTLLFE